MSPKPTLEALNSKPETPNLKTLSPTLLPKLERRAYDRAHLTSAVSVAENTEGTNTTYQV